MKNTKRKYYYYKHRFIMFVNQIKRWLKLSKVFLKFWHIPFDLERYNYAVNYADHQIDDMSDAIKRRDKTIENLANELASEYQYGSEQMSEEESYREAYRFAYGEEEWQEYIPEKYLTKKEQDDKLDRDIDAYVTYDPIAESSYYDLMRYELNRLKGGLYEKRKYI